MTLDEVVIGEEVICSSLRGKIESPDSLATYRGVGHIGRVKSVFPMSNHILVEHIEYTGGGNTDYVAFLTLFYPDELRVFTPPEKALQNAIKALKDDLN